LRYRVEHDDPIVSMSMRAELDRRILEASAAAGARTFFPCRLDAIASHGGLLRLETSRGPFQSPPSPRSSRR
jgi:hypothetical protein